VSRAPASASRAASSTSGGGKASAKPKRTTKRKAAPSVPETPGRARIIAIANQKGGVGKSTTAVSLGAALAELGYRVLVADLDPQGNASTGLGIRHESREVTVYDVVVAEADIHEAIVPTPLPRLHAVPATIDLAGAEIELVSQFSRETRLKKAIEPVSEGVYDFILLDCPPSLGLLTINALTAAEELIVPIQCEYYALEGLGQLLRNVSLVQQNINAGLRLSGIVMTMFDPRTKLSEQVVAEVQRYFGDLVYGVIIPRTVRLSEAPGFGQPITAYDARSRGAEAYRELAREVALRPPPETPMPSFDDLPLAVMIESVPNGGGSSTPLLEAESRSDRPADDPVDDVDRAEETPAGDEPEAPAPDPTTTAPAAAEPADGAEDVFEEPPSAVEPEAVAPAEPQADVDVGSRPPPAAALQPNPQEEDLWVESRPEPEPRVKRPSRPAAPGELPERRVVVIDEANDIDIRAGQEEPPPPPGTEEPRPGMSEIGATLEEEPGRKRRWRMFRKGGDG
jgi:chromosome partitioning protein